MTHVQGDTDEPLLLVATCAGHRCAALHRLGAGSDEEERSELRAAVRAHPHGVLMSTGCQGACHLGGLAAVGWATGGRSGLRWSSRPTVVTGVHQPDRAGALAGWIRDQPVPQDASGRPGLREPRPPRH